MTKANYLKAVTIDRTHDLVKWQKLTELIKEKYDVQEMVSDGLMLKIAGYDGYEIEVYPVIETSHSLQFSHVGLLKRQSYENRESEIYTERCVSASQTIVAIDHIIKLVKAKQY